MPSPSSSASLSDLAVIAGTQGPFAVAYLDASRDTADGAHAVELRWRELRDDLAGQGADEATLTAMDAVVGSDHRAAGRHGQALVAAHGEVLVAETLPRPPRVPGASFSRLPHLMPLVAQRAEAVPYLVVVVDHAGADITVHGRAADGPEGRDSETKVGGAGWSQRRYQDSVDDRWEKSAAAVAHRVDRLVLQSHAQVVIAAGDVRALSLVREHLGSAAAAVFTTVDEGGRGAGRDTEALQRHVERLVAEQAAAEVQRRLESYRTQAGWHDKAASGLADVVAAVRRAQVEALLLQDEPSATTMLWAGADPFALGLRREDVSALGEEEPFEDRADAVLIRALIAQDADLVVVPAGSVELAGRIGAILRYADPDVGSY